MNLIVLLFVLLLLFGGSGFYGYNAGWYGGYHFGGGIGLLILILIVLMLAGRF